MKWRAPSDKKLLKLDLKDSANNDPRPKRALEKLVPKQKHKPYKKEIKE